MAGGSVISWKGRKWMPEDTAGRKKLLRRGTKVEVLSLLDNSFALAYKGKVFSLRQIVENMKG